MATALQNALKRKKELQRELAEIEQFIVMHQRFATLSEAAAAARDIAADASPTPESSASDMSDKKRGRPAEFADLIEEILKETRKPLQRNEIVVLLEKRGIDIPSDDKPRYIGTILWRQRERFINIPNKGYTVREYVSKADMANHEAMQEMFDDLGHLPGFKPRDVME